MADKYQYRTADGSNNVGTFGLFMRLGLIKHRVTCTRDLVLLMNLMRAQ